MMKLFMALCLSCASLSLPPQAAPQTSIRKDGVLQFKYPSILVRCTEKQTQEGWWIPDEDCNSQGQICNDAESSTVTIACFAYPKERFKNKREFSAAAFFVAEVRAATARESCLKGSEYWLIAKTEDTTIHSVRMKHFTTSDAWTGGGESGEIYRAFRGTTCYEFGIQWASTSPSSFDPGTIKPFTKRDAAKVSSALRRPIDSFTFVK
jgi:hypothetical protein